MKRSFTLLFIACLASLITVISFAAKDNKSAKTNKVVTKTESAKVVKQNGEVKPFKPKQNIFGNPLGGRDNYTVNSTKEADVYVECVFINTADKPAYLDIWTDPTTLKSQETIHLEKGSKAKPFQVSKNFHFKLHNNWWCRIYTPHAKNNKKWSYCSYFSISDATIVEFNPFATWVKTSKDKDTSYSCRIKKPTRNVSFFYFKK